MSDCFDKDDFENYEEDDVVCKYCHASGLVWEDNGSGYKLYTEDHQKHVCSGRGSKPSADDFDAL